MKRRTIYHLLPALLAILIVLSAVSCGPSAPPPTPTLPPTPTVHPGQALVSSRCGSCHPLGMVEAQKLDKAGWEYIVDTMVTRGAQLNTEQRAVVVDYLAATYPK